MGKRLVFACLAIAALGFFNRLRAQFTDPRTYTNSPVGVNEFEVDYDYAHGNASIDTSLVFGDAVLNLNQGVINYTRDFALAHRLAWVEASLPIAGLDGSVSGESLHGAKVGLGDSSYQWAMLLTGGPALSVKQFDSYKPVTSAGVSLTITAPTGQYNAQELVNLGSHSWSLMPEIGVSHPFGPGKRWVLDAYANLYLYTDNTAYLGSEVLRQSPLPGLELHLSYSFTPSIFASVDTRYSFGGNTFVDGVTQSDAQQNFTVGSELNISLNDQNLLVLELAGTPVHHNGPEYIGFAVKYVYTWGKGYR